MNICNKEILLQKLIDNLDLPDSAYEKAIDRYQDIGEWIGRPESSCSEFEPHIFPQGSFRLGTAIKPLNENEMYDLDLACNFRFGIQPLTHSQEELKTLVGIELEAYRIARNIKSDLEEKHRCWRLEYADHIHFHMDIVPCVPANVARKGMLFESLRQYGTDQNLAGNISEKAVCITDDRHPAYEEKGADWQISNPEGYALWFSSRVKLGLTTRSLFEASRVDEVPLYKEKAPLQRAIQLLKRHRDKMFAKNPESKPISIIISTIAAQSYSGEQTIEEALRKTLMGLKQFADSGLEVVPNPVNPDENFADRWNMPECTDLQLKRNFVLWVSSALRDFNFILNDNQDITVLLETIEDRFSIHINQKEISQFSGTNDQLIASNILTPKRIDNVVAKPWRH